jgi:glycosyltransferase involved in cell wall biosynthesis
LLTQASPPFLTECDVSVIIPFRDEESTIEELFAAVTDVLDRAVVTFEVVFVDDGSTDRSAFVVDQLAKHDFRARLLQLRRNFGKAAALATGFRESRGRCVVTMDADLQDDPEEIPRLLRRMDDGYDVICGWKRNRRDPLSRRFASKVFNAITSRASGLRLHDCNCGLKAYRSECAKEIADNCYGELHRYLPMLAHWRGYRVTELAVNHRPRLHGRSRYGLERYVRGGLDLITALLLSRYSRRPMHVFGGLGLVLFGLGSLSLTYLAAIKIFGAAIGGRPLLDFAIVAFIAGMQLILTGVLAEVLTGQRSSVVPYSAVSPSPEVVSYQEPGSVDDLVVTLAGADASLRQRTAPGPG